MATRKDHRHRTRVETSLPREGIYAARKKKWKLVVKEGERLLVELAGRVRQIRNARSDGLVVLGLT